AYILRPYAGWNGWLTPIVVVTCVLAALVLTIVRLPLRLKLPARALAGIAALGMIALLVAPAVWAGDTVRNNAAAGGMPSGGPASGNSKQLEQFLLANQGSAKYLIAVSGAGEAEQLILDTGKPVMAMGGFSGSDPILTAQSFAALVKQGVVRFVRLGGMGGGA